MTHLVVIEAGHGGQGKDFDPGAVVQGVREADIVGNVAHLIGDLSDGFVKYAVKRRVSTALLAQLFAAIRRARPEVVVSLHCNSSPHPVELHRAEIQFLSGRQGSADLAYAIEAAASDPETGFAERAAVISAPYNRDGKPFVPGILRLGTRAAVLVELGYLTDFHAREAMLTPEFQCAAAKAIDRKVREFLR